MKGVLLHPKERIRRIIGRYVKNAPVDSLEDHIFQQQSNIENFD